MASVSHNKANGTRRLLFVDADGARKSVRLGAMPGKSAQAFRLRVEAILSARAAGVPLDSETARWLGDLPKPMHDRLVKVGLSEARETDGANSLGALLDRWADALVVKESTRTGYAQVTRSLREHFGDDRLVRTITARDAEAWRAAVRDAGYAPATCSKWTIMARAIFARAVRWKMTGENPFTDVRAGSQTNRERMRFVTLDESRAVLDACPTTEWRLIFALSRFAGLRCPSEHFALRWEDIDWSRGRMIVRCGKTEGSGRAERSVPIFPELREHLLAQFVEAPDKAEYVLGRRGRANLRTTMTRIVRRAGLTPWPRLFHNLRSTRQIELSQEYPAHVVCSWLGNSAAVANAHYLTTLDSDFARACETPTRESGAECGALVAQKAAQHASARTRTESQESSEPVASGDVVRSGAQPCDTTQNWVVAPAGFEPAT